MGAEILSLFEAVLLQWWPAHSWGINVAKLLVDILRRKHFFSIIKKNYRHILHTSLSIHYTTFHVAPSLQLCTTTSLFLDAGMTISLVTTPPTQAASTVVFKGAFSLKCTSQTSAGQPGNTVMVCCASSNLPISISWTAIRIPDKWSTAGE